MIEHLQKIYAGMSDNLSKKIYIDRLNYSVTHKRYYLEKMVDRTVRSSEEWKTFCGRLKESAHHGELYLFGAGMWGNILYNETKAEIWWKGVIDNRPDGRAVAGLKIVTMDQFMDQCRDCSFVVISSYTNGSDMINQLQEKGFSPDRILDAGRVIHGLTEGSVYFDKTVLQPLASREYFVDAGGFDGLTTDAFFKWCSNNGHSYCFEADPTNVSIIRNRLEDYVNCEIIPKALWSHTTSLFMNKRGGCASAVIDRKAVEGMQRIEAVALDDILRRRPVTYIKMDIEGAELEAIRGARRIIQEQRPKLAISIYHKYEDIWTIPLLLLDYCPGYKFYMRHYSFSDYDTVLYAVHGGNT